VRGRRRALLAAALLIAAAVGAWLALRPAPLPVLGTLPEFALVERAGTAFGSRDLAGGVWIADFVFTRCPDFCPALTARMGGLQKALPRDGEPVRLVSFSVDPAYDTPEVLRAYAARAAPARVALPHRPARMSPASSATGSRSRGRMAARRRRPSRTTTGSCSSTGRCASRLLPRHRRGRRGRLADAARLRDGRAS
jgi:hypothetical protein